MLGDDPNGALQIAPRPSSSGGARSLVSGQALEARLDRLRSELAESGRPFPQPEPESELADDESVRSLDDAASLLSESTARSQRHGAPFTHIRRHAAQTLAWGNGGEAFKGKAISTIGSSGAEPLVQVGLRVESDGPDGREGYVHIDFTLTLHQLGSDYWGAETDLASCEDVLENKQSGTAAWWRERDAKVAKKSDERGPEFAAMSAFRECDFAPVSMFMKMLKDERQVVNLSHYHLGPQGAIAISRSVDSSRHIGTLLLADTGLRDEGIAAIASALRTNFSVSILDLRGNPFGEPGMRELAEAMLINSSVVSLSLRDNGLRDVEIEMLARSLHDNTTVRKLDLGSNQCNERGAMALATMLEYNNYINHLHLDWNEVQLAGSQALAVALSKNVTLETLIMGHNALHNYGAIKLSESLIANCTLRTLDLQHNSIGVEGVYAISHGMTRNKGLTALDLSGNIVGQEAIVILSRFACCPSR